MAITRLVLLLLLSALATASLSFAQTAKVRVEIVGLEGELERNALAVASIVNASNSGELSTNQIRRLHVRAAEEIELALQPFGYYRATIGSALDTAEPTWLARYDVNPGPPILLSSVDVRVLGVGATDSAFIALVADFPLSVGDTLVHLKYTEGKLELGNFASENGYLDAVFDTNEVRVDLETYTAEVVLHVDTGPRFFFGPVTLNQDIVDPRLLQGYVTFEPGDTFKLSKLIEMQRGLSSTSFFSQVEIKPQREKADSLCVPIWADLTPRKRGRYEVGLGFGTDYGIRGTFEAEFRRLNRRGHNATTRVELSQLERIIIAQYRFPPAYPETATWAVSASAGDFSPTWTSSLSAGLAVSRSVTRGPLREVLSLSYDAQRFTIAGDEDTSRLLIPSASWAWIRSDNSLLTLHGNRVRLDVRASIDEVLSSASFLQLVLSGKFVRRLVPGTRLLARASLGRTWTQQFNSLPPNIRFVTGGDNTVRGYGFETLGPRNEEGAIVGGDYLLVGSVEVDYKLLEKWALAAFFDTGNALSPSTPFFLAKGAGIGARWLSPVGPVRLDLAYGFNKPSESFRIHFTVGPDI